MKISSLRNKCQPKDPKRPYSWSEIINRKFSIFFTALLIKTPLNANQVSLLSVVVGLIACLLLLANSRYAILLGAFLFIVWETLDYSDGEVARYRNQSSLTGLYVDRVAGMLVGCAQYVFIGYLVYNMTGDLLAFAFAFSAAISRPIATLTSHHMQVSALEALLYDYRVDKSVKEIFDAVKIKGYENEGSFIPDLDQVGVQQRSIIHKIAWFFFKGIGRHILVIIATAFDLFLIRTDTMSTILHSLTGIYLIVYGVFTPIAWIWMITLIIKNRSTEALYARIIVKAKSLGND